MDQITSGWKTFQKNPSAYNFFDFITLGALSMVNGAFEPEEPFSFEHVMNMIGTATLVFGAAKAAKRVRAGEKAPDPGIAGDGADDAARAAVDAAGGWLG